MSHLISWNGSILGLTCAIVLAATPLRADKADPARIQMELNRLDEVGGACRISLVLTNGLAVPIEEAAFELVLFDKEKAVIKLLAVNPGRLAAAKTRVRQFDLKGQPCSQIGHVLLNDVSRCKGEGLSAAKCLDVADPSSRVAIRFIK